MEHVIHFVDSVGVGPIVVFNSWIVPWHPLLTGWKEDFKTPTILKRFLFQSFL